MNENGRVEWDMKGILRRRKNVKNTPKIWEGIRGGRLSKEVTLLLPSWRIVIEGTTKNITKTIITTTTTTTTTAIATVAIIITEIKT